MGRGATFTPVPWSRLYVGMELRSLLLFCLWYWIEPGAWCMLAKDSTTELDSHPFFKIW